MKQGHGGVRALRSQAAYGRQMRPDTGAGDGDPAHDLRPPPGATQDGVCVVEARGGDAIQRTRARDHAASALGGPGTEGKGVAGFSGTRPRPGSPPWGDVGDRAIRRPTIERKAGRSSADQGPGQHRVGATQRPTQPGRSRPRCLYSCRKGLGIPVSYITVENLTIIATEMHYR